jgi:hypothetical protein
MANIEIKILGANRRDLELALAELADTFKEHPSLDDIGLDELIKYTTIRCEQQQLKLSVAGMDDAVMIDEAVVNIPEKKSRRAKSLALPVAETNELGDNDYEVPPVEETPEQVKEAAIVRLKKIYFENPRGATVIDRIIKKHGGGETLFMKIPAERYPNIVAELDREGL